MTVYTLYRILLDCGLLLVRRLFHSVPALYRILLDCGQSSLSSLSTSVSSLYRILLDCGRFVAQSGKMCYNKIIRVLYVIRENPRFRQQVSTKTLHTHPYRTEKVS